MKQLLFAISCLGCLALNSADAMAQPFNWTGFYVGANVGGGTMTSSSFGNTSQSFNTLEATGPLPQRFGISMLSGAVGLNGKGAVAGGQAGYNYQMGNWVFGVEGEGYWSGIKMVNNGSTILNGVPFETFGTTVKNNDDFAIAGRLGIAFDRTLIFAKGGWTWGSFDASSFDNCCGAAPVRRSASWGGTLDGFLVGAGIEHALTRNVTIKFEYNYIGFGTKEVALTQCVVTISTGICAQTGTASLSATKQIFKVGANYLFNGP